MSNYCNVFSRKSHIWGFKQENIVNNWQFFLPVRAGYTDMKKIPPYGGISQRVEKQTQREGKGEREPSGFPFAFNKSSFSNFQKLEKLEAACQKYFFGKLKRPFGVL